MGFNVEKVQNARMEPIVVPEVDTTSYVAEQTFNYEATEDDKNMGLQVETEGKTSIEEIADRSPKGAIGLGYTLGQSYGQVLKMNWNFIKDVFSGKGVINSYETMVEESYKIATEHIQEYPVASYITGARVVAYVDKLLLGKDATNDN